MPSASLLQSRPACGGRAGSLGDGGRRTGAAALGESHLAQVGSVGLGDGPLGVGRVQLDALAAPAPPDHADGTLLQNVWGVIGINRPPLAVAVCFPDAAPRQTGRRVHLAGEHLVPLLFRGGGHRRGGQVRRRGGGGQKATRGDGGPGLQQTCPLGHFLWNKPLGGRGGQSLVTVMTVNYTHNQTISGGKQTQLGAIAPKTHVQII